MHRFSYRSRDCSHHSFDSNGFAALFGFVKMILPGRFFEKFLVFGDFDALYSGFPSFCHIIFSAEEER